MPLDLGFPDQALAYGRQLLAVRHDHIDFIGRFPALVFAAMLYSFLRDTPAVQMLGEELTAISTGYDFPFFAMEGQVLSGWALAQQGDVQEGLPLLRMGIEDQRRRGIRMFEPYYRSLLAETLALAGEWEEALDEVTEALAYAEECGNQLLERAAAQAAGRLHAGAFPRPSEVEACYQRAIATAARQGAKSLELRATTSLCRLWQRQGKQARHANADGNLRLVHRRLWDSRPAGGEGAAGRVVTRVRHNREQPSTALKKSAVRKLHMPPSGVA